MQGRQPIYVHILRDDMRAKKAAHAKLCLEIERLTKERDILGEQVDTVVAEYKEVVRIENERVEIIKKIEAAHPEYKRKRDQFLDCLINKRAKLTNTTNTEVTAIP